MKPSPPADAIWRDQSETRRPRPLRVVKVGGSLLGQPDLANRLADWIGRDLSEDWLVVVGGGWLADGVRHWSRRREALAQGSVADEILHFRAIESMAINAVALRGNFPRESQISDGLTWRAGTRPVIAFWDPLTWCHRNRTLPRTWEVTSDSLAAALALQHEAQELILLKSRLPTEQEMASGPFRSSVVDLYFQHLVDQLAAVRIVNFASVDFREWRR